MGNHPTALDLVGQRFGRLVVFALSVVLAVALPLVLILAVVALVWAWRVLF